MCEVIPGILEKEWSEIEKKLEIVKPFARTVHIDLLDGKMVPNTTFLDPTPFKKYSDYFFFELHMMVENPIQYLKPFADVGFKRFMGHIEKMPDQDAFVAEAQLVGEAMLAIDGKTPLDKIHVQNYEDLDGLLVMTINAGFSGQVFVPEYLKKVEILRSAQNDMNIEVDGGINNESIVLAKQAGANRFVATSFIFKEDPRKQYNILKDIVKE